MAQNPGGLGTLGGSSIAFVSTLLDREHTVVGGGGFSLFLAQPLRFELSGIDKLTLTYGFGFQVFKAPDSWIGATPAIADQNGSYLLNSIGVGFREISVGWTVGNYFWASTPQNESITTHHVGISLRPSRFLAAGLTVRDVFEPVGRAPEEKIARSYDGELAVRPLGDWRLELAAGAVAGEDHLYDFRGRAAWRPVQGIRLFGRFESVERRFGPPGAETSRDERVVAGLQLDGLDAFAGRRNPELGAAYGALTSSKSEHAYAGSSFELRWSREVAPALVEPERMDRVELDAGGSDRDFVGALLRLRRLEGARGVAGVLLILRGGGGFARAEEIRDAVRRLRRAGRRVVAYLYRADMSAYYAAAACDRILLHPSASIDLRGAAVENVYLAELLGDLGIQAQVVRIAEYKSAPEILTRRSASEPALREIRSYLDDVIDHFVNRTGEDRGLPPARVRALLERPAITPPQAQELGLVDGVAHPDELEDAVERLFGRRVDIARTPRRKPRPTQWAYPRIAVIHVSGDILPGRGGDELFLKAARGEEIADAIRDARESSKVAAIVVRVDSPGGAVLPSERIAREIELTAGEKPIVVSMGNVAASGGYMVSAPADRVFASPSTLTGSIGVFALKLSVRDFLKRFGVHPESVKVGEHADADSLLRPWTREEKRAQKRQIEYTYRRFVDLVARGRDMPADKVREVGGGRIWSGSRAREIGLVDQLGGFRAALEEARRLAGIGRKTGIEVVQRPVVSRNLLAKLFLGAGESRARALRCALPPAFREALERLPPSILYGGGALARLPWVSTRIGDSTSLSP